MTIKANGEPSPPAFYDGWNAHCEYLRDVRQIGYGYPGFGFMAMVIGGVIFFAPASLAIFIIVSTNNPNWADIFNWTGVVKVMAVSAVVFVIGLFINRLERNAFRKRQEQFKQKWGKLPW